MYLKLAYLNLFRNKRRSFSTGLAICIGFVGLNLLGAYIYRTKMGLETTSIYSGLRGHVRVYKKDSLVQFGLHPKKYVLGPNDIQQIYDVLKPINEKVDYTGLNLTGSGLLSNGVKSHPVIFVSFEPEVYARSLLQPNMEKWAKDWILASQLLNIEIFRKNNEVMSVTPKIAEIMSFKYPLASNDGAQLAARSFDGDLNAINLDLGAEHTTGMQFLEDTVVLVPLKKSQELLGTDGAESISIYLKPDENAKDFKNWFDEKAKSLPFEIDSYFYYDEKINSLYLGTMGFLIVMSGFFVFLIGTAVSLTIVNSLTMGIIERTKEIGTLLAVGFRKSDVQKVFILENIVLCIFAMIIGTGLSALIAAVVNSLNIQFIPPAVSGKIQFRLVWNIYIGVTVGFFILLLTWLSSVIVMRSKSKTKLIDLLNDSGA